MYLDEMVGKGLGLTSFTAVGHLILVNLKENLLSQKEAIGKALLDNNKRAVAVCNKINSIENVYRTSEIEVIAKRPGCELDDEELMICEVNQNKCRFKLDISKVYWNSRLSTEHERFVNKLNKSIDIVFDVCAGVGPFSVPAAKAKCKTFANDLNPDSIKWLRVNMERNKVSPSMYKITNKDAKEFIQHDIRTELLNIYTQIDHEQPATMPKIHILMNLPASAPTFLPHFVGLFTKEREKSHRINDKLLTTVFRDLSIEHVVNCYCFLKGAFDDDKREVRKMIEENFGRELTDTQLVEIFKVRNVAPFKNMYRVEIRLDEQILFGDKDLVSIMKKTGAKSPVMNGNGKRVVMNVEGVKRTHEESCSLSDNGDGPEPETPEEETPKRARPSDYSCSIM